MSIDFKKMKYDFILNKKYAACKKWFESEVKRCRSMCMSDSLTVMVDVDLARALTDYGGFYPDYLYWKYIDGEFRYDDRPNRNCNSIDKYYVVSNWQNIKKKITAVLEQSLKDVKDKEKDQTDRYEVVMSAKVP